MKRITKIYTIILLLISTLNVYASTNTIDRSTQDNLGVNKKWNITERNRSAVLKTPYVDASEKVYDFAELLTEEEEKILKERIDKFIQNTNMDMVIITTSFNYHNDSENEDYAADFYDYNDFGIKYKKYDGILFLRNANPSNQYYDMYTFGNSQLYFSHYAYDTILDGIYDDIHIGNYLNGLNQFIDYCEKYIQSGIPSDLEDYYVDDNGYLKKNLAKFSFNWILCSFISTIITIIVMTILIKKNKMVKKAYNASIYLNFKSKKITNVKDNFIRSHTSSYTEVDSSSSSGSSSSGGSYSSHSGSSGGGHSSGGGRHG